MRKFLLKKQHALLIITMLLSLPALLNAQHKGNFFKNRFHQKLFHSLNKPGVNNTQKNGQQRKKDPACIEWQKTIGGTGEEDRGAIKTVHDGYITCGSTTSTDGDFRLPANHDFDAYVAKLNKKGEVIWTHTYGGSGYEDFNDILPTADGGFIAIGAATSNDGDVIGHHGDEDVWVVKCDSDGKIQWQHCYGGMMEDHGNFIVPTPSGYAFCAGAASSDGDLTSSNIHGLLDAWIVKISFAGETLFQQTYGGSDDEDALGIYFNEADKTIVFASTTNSNEGDVLNNHGDVDAWVVKIDAIGNFVWKKTLGGSGEEEIGSLVKTSDGNVVISGYSNSTDGDIIGNNGLYVAWLFKLNPATGNIVWNKTYTDPAELGALGVFATSDGGTVVMGLFGSSSDAQTWDAWIMKTDKSGNKHWAKFFGGNKTDFAAFGAEATNGDIITSNYTESNDGDVKKAYGFADSWIVLLDKCGNTVSNKPKEQKNIAPGFINTLSSYPNPFSNSTTISLTLPQSQKVSISIFDMNGRLIKTVADEQMQLGIHQLTWNTTDENGNLVSSGIYFLRINTKNYTETKKLVVVK